MSSLRIFPVYWDIQENYVHLIGRVSTGKKVKVITRFHPQYTIEVSEHNCDSGLENLRQMDFVEKVDHINSNKYIVQIKSASDSHRLIELLHNSPMNIIDKHLDNDIRYFRYSYINPGTWILAINLHTYTQNEYPLAYEASYLKTVNVNSQPIDLKLTYTSPEIMDDLYIGNSVVFKDIAHYSASTLRNFIYPLDKHLSTVEHKELTSEDIQQLLIKICDFQVPLNKIQHSNKYFQGIYLPLIHTKPKNPLHIFIENGQYTNVNVYTMDAYINRFLKQIYPQAGWYNSWLNGCLDISQEDILSKLHGKYIISYGYIFTLDDIPDCSPIIKFKQMLVYDCDIVGIHNQQIYVFGVGSLSKPSFGLVEKYRNIYLQTGSIPDIPTNWEDFQLQTKFNKDMYYYQPDISTNLGKMVLLLKEHGVYLDDGWLIWYMTNNGPLPIVLTIDDYLDLDLQWYNQKIRKELQVLDI